MDRPTPQPGTAAEREALRLLATRPRTVSELAARLTARGHAEREVERIVERLVASGQLDDLALSRHFIVTRAERLGHGPARLLADLERRGVPRRVAEAALDQLVAAGDLEPRALVRRRLRRELARHGGGLDERAHLRVYNALLRAGFEPELVQSELEPHRSADDPTASDPGSDNELP